MSEKTMGAIITMLRHARGMTQVELAERLSGVVGLQQPKISAIENGTFEPTAGQMHHILKALEATPQDRQRVMTLAGRMAVR